MLVTALCLTYMMVIILIHAVWISAIIKHDGKCHYNNCGHCPYDGWCPLQEGDTHGDKLQSNRRSDRAEGKR